MQWTNKDGSKMVISYSQKLQERTVYLLLFIAIFFAITTLLFAVMVGYFAYRLDSINFFTSIMGCI